LYYCYLVRIGFIIFISVFFAFYGRAQKLSFKGSINDTTIKQPLPGAVVMAIRYIDSSLVSFTRSNINGFFEINELPLDTYRVVISHKKFGDKVLFLIGSPNNYEFEFNNLSMPPKSVSLEEVTIFAFKDPIYYKGDTLVYTADSFKVKPNATVEDLLRRLPGMRVDAAGKITAQGKEVNKVLVDGDEFFGSDPTMATRNLAAKSIESVQLYEKKDDEANSGDDKETIQVMNLKLKDDAKKGYFGRISAGSDIQNFYEGEVLANRFTSKQKVSFFMLASNTPRTGFGWSDANKYGLDNEFDYGWDEDMDAFVNRGNNGDGIPRTINTGVYYNEKFGNKVKINANYTFKENDLLTQSEEQSQYFLGDTSYVTNNQSRNRNTNQNHVVNVRFNWDIDSFTKLQLSPSLTINKNKSSSFTYNNFVTTENFVTRETNNQSSNTSEGLDFSNRLRAERTFRKKHRLLVFNYNTDYSDHQGNGNLLSRNTFFTSTTLPLTDFDQLKESEAFKNGRRANISYIEPIGKKIKLETSYEYVFSNNKQNKLSFNKINDVYEELDSLFSNDFNTRQDVHKAWTNFMYEMKKYHVHVGAQVRRVTLNNENYFTGKNIQQQIDNILPFVRAGYVFNPNTRLNFNYRAQSQQPAVNQLQPLPNNANQNFITLGNPSLKPTFSNNFRLSFNSYKPISGKYFWSNITFNQVNNAFSSELTYDSIGRSISRPVNVNGNYFGNAYIGGGWPLFSRMLTIHSSLSSNIFSNNNIINGQKNTTRNATYGSNLDLSLVLEKIQFDIGGNYEYNVPWSTLNQQNNKPYTTQRYNLDGKIELPKKFFIEPEVIYTLNGQRADGYNINFLIINAAVSKQFGKLENFIVAFKAFDVLNQNIVANRQVYNNIITDSKTTIISRYFLLHLTYKFNSQKVKEADEDDD